MIYANKHKATALHKAYWLPCWIFPFFAFHTFINVQKVFYIVQFILSTPFDF